MFHEVTIKRGATVADLKRAVSVPQNYNVIRRKTEAILKNGQNLYELMEEDERLVMCPPSRC